MENVSWKNPLCSDLAHHSKFHETDFREFKFWLHQSQPGFWSPRHPHSNNFFVPLGTEKRNKSPQADQKPGNSNVLYKFNNNSYTDFRTT